MPVDTHGNPYADQAAKSGNGVAKDGYSVVLVDEPAPHVRRITMNRPDKRNALNHALRGEVLHALQAGDMDPDVHVMIVSRRGQVLLRGLRPGRRQRGPRLPVLHGRRRRPVAAPRHRGLDEHLGPGQAGDRPGPRLLPRGRQRARDGLRPRLHGRGRADGLSGRTLWRARHALPRLARRHAQGHGDDAHGRFDRRSRGRRRAAGRPTASRPTSSSRRSSRWPSASR